MAAIAPQMSEFNADMKRLLRSIQPAAIALGLLAATALLAVATPGSTRQEGVQSLRIEKLSNAPGTLFTIGTDNSSPDGRSLVRYQGERAFACILTHAVRSEDSATGPVKIYKAGEGFFEPAGGKHIASENTSATDPASMLVILIAENGMQLTTTDDWGVP